MAEGDRAAVVLTVLGFELQLAHAGQGLGCEGFVKLDGGEVRYGEPARYRTLRVAGTGPMPMVSGAAPVRRRGCVPGE